MMNKKSVLRSTLAVGLAVACLALNANAGSQISGRVQIKTNVDVNKVETGRNAWVHLGAVNLKNVNAGGDLNVNSRLTVGGTVRADKSSVVNLASVQLADMTIKGPATFDLTARIDKGVTTEQGAEVMIGGVSITNDNTSGGYNNPGVDQAPDGNQTAAVLSPALPEGFIAVIDSNLGGNSKYGSSNNNFSDRKISADASKVASEILNSSITQKYDTSIKYKIPDQRPGKHDGLDYVLPGGKNAKVRTPVGGIIKIIPDPYPGKKKGWGNRVIVVDSKGKEHCFGHLESISSSLKTGTTIKAGTVIGNQGNSGYTKGKTGIHVDYRIKENGKYIDPEIFLKDLI